MPAIAIRPRRATEIVDASFQLLRRFYPQLVTLMAITMAPSVFAALVRNDPTPDPTFIMKHPGTVAGPFFIVVICWMFANSVLVIAVSDGYLNSSINLARSLRDGIRRLLVLFAANVVRYLIFMGALLMVALIVGLAGAVVGSVAKVGGPGGLVWLMVPVIVGLSIWFFCLVYMGTFACTAAIVLERVGPLASLTRSWRLTKGCRLHVFCTLILSWLLYLVFSIITAILGKTLLTPIIAQVVGAVVFVLVFPFVTVVSTLLYYDLRVRREGFDLEVMSRELGGSTTIAAPLPAA